MYTLLTRFSLWCHPPPDQGYGLAPIPVAVVAPCRQRPKLFAPVSLCARLPRPAPPRRHLVCVEPGCELGARRHAAGGGHHGGAHAGGSSRQPPRVDGALRRELPAALCFNSARPHVPGPVSSTTHILFQDHQPQRRAVPCPCSPPPHPHTPTPTPHTPHPSIHTQPTTHIVYDHTQTLSTNTRSNATLCAPPTHPRPTLCTTTWMSSCTPSPSTSLSSWLWASGCAPHLFLIKWQPGRGLARGRWGCCCGGAGCWRSSKRPNFCTDGRCPCTPAPPCSITSPSTPPHPNPPPQEYFFPREDEAKARAAAAFARSVAVPAAAAARHRWVVQGSARGSGGGNSGGSAAQEPVTAAQACLLAA